MISTDDLLVVDPTRCPDCGAGHDGSADRCPACGLPLRGALAARLWTVSVALRGLQLERRDLLGALRRGEVPVAGAAGRAAATAAVPTPGLRVPAAPARPEWSARRVQNLLLGLGVALVVVAVLIFAAFAYGRLGPGARAALLAALTAGTAGTVPVLLRRRLTSSAEAVAGVAVTLALGDAVLVRRADLLGLAGLRGSSYLALTAAVVAAAACLAALRVPVQTARVTGALLGQVPGLVLVSRAGSAPAAAVVLAAQATALGLVAAALEAPAWRRARGLVAAGSVAGWAAGAALAAHAAYPRLVREATVPVGVRDGAVALGVLALVAGIGAWLLRLQGDRSGAIAGASDAAALAGTLVLLAALCAPARALLPLGERALAPALAGLLAVLAGSQLAAAWRRGPVVAGLLAAGIGVVLVAEPVLLAVSGPFGWPADPWSGAAGGSASELVAPLTAWHGGAGTAVVLLLGACSVALAGVARVVAARYAAVAAALLGTLTVVVVPVAADLPYRAGVALIGIAGAAALAVAGRVSPRLWQQSPLRRLELACAGGALVAVALAWSLADRATSLTAIALAAAGALAVAVGASPPVRVLAGAVAAGLGGGEVFAVARAAGAPVDRAGFLLALAGLAVVGVGAALRRGAPEGPALELTGLALAGAGLVGTAGDAGWASWTLTAAGLAGLALALRDDRRAAAVAGAVLLTAASWLRLHLAEVSLVEAYAVPPALVALALGLLRRRAPGPARPRSWAAYGPGLTGALLPSLALAVARTDLTRPVLLGVACLGVLLVGVRSRLQAPLLAGAGVLLADVVAQVTPAAAALPRWASIGTAGVLVLVLGVTYERQLDRLRRLRAGVARFG